MISADRVRLFVCVFAALFISVVAVPVARAQSTSTGTVSGQVTDPQGGIIAGADVRLIDVGTNTPRTTTTNDTGRYSFINVDPGTYNIEVQKSGFSLSKVPGQQVNVGLVLTINVTLQIGSTATTVEVQASAGAELQTASATVGDTIEGHAIMSLPNLGRDANAFVLLQPGVSPNGNVAGAVTDQNTFQLDGGNNTNDMDGTSATYTQGSGYIGSAASGGSPSGTIPTPAESIEEFKVATNNQTADFNGAAGGQVQMVTKRGTNQFHGSLYDYYLGSNFGANTWKNNHTPSGSLKYTPLPSSHQNRFGASLGGPLTPNLLGGKTYFFVNYEGRRFPQVTTVEKQVPTALMRAGVIQLPNSAGVYQAYNLNSVPVTVNGVTYQPAQCGTASCDPRRIGLNPIVNQIWSRYMPMPNDPQAGDTYNTQGYLSAVRLPQSSDFGVVRLDHDFGQKWHLMTSYRYYSFNELTSSQVDIGGAFSGDTFGQATATSPHVQKPSYYVAGLTTTITPNLTNDFHWSYLRNFWQWFSALAPPQLPGLGGAVEIGGETGSGATGANALIPYNVNSASVRQRSWDGQDHTFRDDLSQVKGNHLFQFGGSYERNYDYHSRDDNGTNVLTQTVYQIGSGSGINFAGYYPGNLPVNQQSNWSQLYDDVLGVVSTPQVLYSRSGSNLALQPIGTELFDQTVIPTYDMYFSDTWHMRKDFTFTYGLSYTVEMPPYELNGKQVELVDSNGKQISTNAYLASVKQAALSGQAYDPTLGFATIRNVNGDHKYPYNTFYGGLSPRVAAAWNPSFGSGFLGKVFGENKTVVRGGYSRIYGRLNGVDLVLIPLLGTGLGQAVQCVGASSTGQCLGASGVTPATAFRIGTDGNNAPLPAVSQTLAQPYFAGVNGNAAAGDGYALDPNFRPSRSDQFDFTIQRALSKDLSIEAGYIGRIIRNEYQTINLDAVPYMMTLNGQSFANAYANVYNQLNSNQAVTTQPFFESALGGASSSYCARYASCTAAVAANYKSTILATQVFNLWSGLNNASSWTLGRTILSSAPSQLSSILMATSDGFGNYNAAFFSLTARDFHGLTAKSNFTWSHALGTGAVQQTTSGYTVLDNWNLHAMYGPQSFDINLVYNLSLLYQPKIFAGNKGILGRVLGGWSIAPLFTAQSGAPLEVSVGSGTNANCQSFGEANCGSATTNENAVLIAPYTGGNSAHEGVVGTGGIATSGNASTGGSGINMFANPSATYADFRRLILGVDTTGGGAGVLRGFPTWNLDMSVEKDFMATERFGVTFIAQFSNLLNHFQPSNPSLNIDSPQTWGVVTTQLNTPRQIEFGLRIHF